MFRNLSPTAISNLYTMSAASRVDARQKPGKPYTVPDLPTRLARARLHLEEALETIHDLGFDVEARDGEGIAMPINMPMVNFVERREPDLYGIIDGGCDQIYVCCGTLTVCGVPDLPHLAEVCRANDNKFPNGIATVNDHGKYVKPEGWQPPDHQRVAREFHYAFGMDFSRM